MAPPADLQSCGLQYLTVQAYHVATKYDILAFLDAPALKSISIYARFELDLEKLPNLQAFTSKRQDCTIEIKSGKPFSQEVETVLKEIGFSLSSALDGPLIHIASFVPPNTLHENPSSQMSFFDDVLMKQLGEDCQICSDKKLYSRYLEFLSQCSKWVGMTWEGFSFILQFLHELVLYILATVLWAWQLRISRFSIKILSILAIQTTSQWLWTEAEFVFFWILLEYHL